MQSANSATLNIAKNGRNESFQMWVCMFFPPLICYLKFKSEDSAPEGILSQALETLLDTAETGIMSMKRKISTKVRNVTFRCGRHNGDVSVIQSLYFYYQAPVVKFYHRVVISMSKKVVARTNAIFFSFLPWFFLYFWRLFVWLTCLLYLTGRRAQQFILKF